MYNDALWDVVHNINMIVYTLIAHSYEWGGGVILKTNSLVLRVSVVLSLVVLCLPTSVRCLCHFYYGHI